MLFCNAQSLLSGTIFDALFLQSLTSILRCPFGSSYEVKRLKRPIQVESIAFLHSLHDYLRLKASRAGVHPLLKFAHRRSHARLGSMIYPCFENHC